MSSDPLVSVNACWARVSQSPVYKFFLSDVEIVSAEKGIVIAKLKVGPNIINSKKSLHGSASATIVDWYSRCSIPWRLFRSSFAGWVGWQLPLMDSSKPG